MIKVALSYHHPSDLFLSAELVVARWMPMALSVFPVGATDFWAAFLTSFLGPIAPYILITATTSSRAKALLTTLCAEQCE